MGFASALHLLGNPGQAGQQAGVAVRLADAVSGKAGILPRNEVVKIETGIIFLANPQTIELTATVRSHPIDWLRRLPLRGLTTRHDQSQSPGENDPAHSEAVERQRLLPLFPYASARGDPS